MSVFKSFFFNRENKSFQYLFLLVILSTVIKVALIGKGFLALPDEMRYFTSGKAVTNFMNLKIGAGINALYNTHARPGDAFLKMIPHFFQIKLAEFNNTPLYSPQNSYPLFIYNFLILICIEFILYRFSVLIFKDKLKAIFNVLIFSCLTNSFIYLRHALPYDESLLFFYLTIYLLIKQTLYKKMNIIKYFLLGGLAFFSYLCYPGYFPLYLIIIGYLFFKGLSRQSFIKNTFNSIYFGLGSLSVLLLIEFTAYKVGESYLKDAAILSQTILQGSFEESYTFIFKYLFEAEFIAGYLLIISIVTVAFILIFKFKESLKEFGPDLILIISIATIIYLFYGTLGFFFHKFVMYGRLIHQYLPIISFIGTLFVFKLIGDKKNLLLLISVAYIISFIYNIYQFNGVVYPRDKSWELSKKYNLKNIENIYEYKRCFPEFPLEQFNNNHSNDYKILTLNLCYIPHPSKAKEYIEFQNKNKSSMIYNKTHFNNLKSYQFEGFTIKERQLSDKMKLKVKIFKK